MTKLVLTLVVMWTLLWLPLASVLSESLLLSWPRFPWLDSCLLAVMCAWTLRLIMVLILSVTTLLLSSSMLFVVMLLIRFRQSMFMCSVLFGGVLVW